MSDQPDEILAIDEVAAYLATAKHTAYRLASSGKMPAFELGRTLRFRRAEFDQCVAGQIGGATDRAEQGGAE